MEITIKITIKYMFLKLMLNILKDCRNFITIYYLQLKEWKSEWLKKLVANLYDKKEYVVHINLKQASLKLYINMNTELKKNF